MNTEGDIDSKTMENSHQTKAEYAEKFQLLLKMNEFFSQRLFSKIKQGQYNTFSIIPEQDQDRQKLVPMLKKMMADKEYNVQSFGISQKESRAIASFLGLAICDALGASTEFIPFKKDRRDLIANDFLDVESQIKNGKLDARSGSVAIWTDDCSMALCMADSLLLNNFKFDPIHMRYMFIMWLEHGLNNGGRPYSIGLGGNISISIGQFFKNQTEYAIEGEKYNNGNGSLMRLAPVPICFSKNIDEAMKYSELQSRTTHNGDQAKQCSRLLAAIICNLIHRQKENQWRQVLHKTCVDFKTDVKSVKCLAMSQQEPHELYQEQKSKYKNKFVHFNKKLKDRNWNWKDPQYTYSQCRFDSMPGYVGSYCMDALSMALHTVWHSKSFKEIALVNANMGGDCDTVGAVAGQIAGTIYGIDAEMLKLYSQMEDSKSGRFQIFLKGYKLYNNSPLTNAPFLPKQ